MLYAASCRGFDGRGYPLARDPLAWTPASVAVELSERLESEYGREAVTELGRMAAWSSLQHPLFAPLVSGARRFFGARPLGIFSWTPAFWRIATQGVGELSFSRCQDGARLTLRGAPPIVASSEPWCAEIRGRLLAGFDALGRDGEVEVVAGHEPVFIARW